MWKSLVVFVPALVLGFAVARVRSPHPVGKNDAEPTEDRLGRRPPERWERDDFVKWLRRSLDAAGDQDLKEFSDAELRAALDEGLMDPKVALTSGRSGDLMAALFAEWAKRDPEAALRWFESMPSESRKTHLSWILGECWPKDRAAEGLEYVCRNREFFESENGTSSAPLIRLAIEAAALRGPGAVDEVLKKLRENGLGPRYVREWEFPPGFDFAALSASPEAARLLENGSAFYAASWLMQDRDSAFEHLIAKNPSEPRDLIAALFIYLSPIGSSPDTEAVSGRSSWLAGRIDELGADKRRMVALGGVATLSPVPEALAGFTRALSDPEDRQAVAHAAVHQLMKSSLESTLSFLEAVTDPGQRLDLLEAVEPDPYRWPLFAAQQALLRERLASWNIPVNRIDVIIRHLKEVRK